MKTERKAGQIMTKAIASAHKAGLEAASKGKLRRNPYRENGSQMGAQFRAAWFEGFDSFKQESSNAGDQ